MPSPSVPPTTSAPPAVDALVVGGGMMGCSVAEHMARRGLAVLLLEQEADLFARASYANQARVHNGYHYPRSLLTGLRSRVNFPRFAAEFDDCIVRDFTKLYAIARRYSKVTAGQFARFCERIAAPARPADAADAAHFDSRHIEQVFEVTEWAFDAARLRERMRERLADAGVMVRLGAEALRLAPAQDGISVEWRDGAGEHVTRARHVLNCTYASLNGLLAASGLPLVPLRHEHAELALVRLPPALAGLGITVMCGPFFSTMPFPDRKVHSLSHVRYTPHGAWTEGMSGPDDRAPGDAPAAPVASSVKRMLLDAARFVPAIAEAQYTGSLFEVKTLLPSRESDDGRPILFRPHHGLRNLTCILGGKIDNVYDVFAELDALLELRAA